MIKQSVGLQKFTNGGNNLVHNPNKYNKCGGRQRLLPGQQPLTTGGVFFFAVKFRNYPVYFCSNYLVDFYKTKHSKYQ